MSESTLILPSDQPRDTVDALVDRLPEVVWLRNPNTGVIYKYLKKTQLDNIRHALQGETGEGGRPPYTLSNEEAAKAQAIELARLQGRPLPAWANESIIVKLDGEVIAQTLAEAGTPEELAAINEQIAKDFPKAGKR